MSTELFRNMAESIIEGEVGTGKRLAQQAIELGVDPLEAIDKGFVAGMKEVGEQFSKGKVFLPHLVQAAQVMKVAVEILQPELVKRGTARQMLGKVVLGTVKATSTTSARIWWASCFLPTASKCTTLGMTCRSARLLRKSVS